MLVLYILGLAVFISILFGIYGSAIERRGNGLSESRKAELSKSMWRAPSLDCDFEPTKSAFGPGRTVTIDTGMKH